MRTALFLALVAIVGLGCSPGGGMSPDGGSDGGGIRDSGRGIADQDNDGISDVHEGAAEMVDTDGDGTPDYLDTDSDDDGILDADEGSRDAAIPPVDTDGDGTPDFRDTDSDDNGIRDDVEGVTDTDGDGIADYRDRDNDGDTIRDEDEIGPDPSMPIDFDSDGIPDLYDIDSDGDTIHDRHEALPVDTEGDGIPDRHDPDSDGDGLSDAEEAGDADVETPPIDTDDDMVPDFRDADSDDDGLSDAAEVAAGTDPRDADSDDDGVTDLVESASGTDPLDPGDSPRTRGDFVFLVPYMEDPSPPRDTLEFSTDIQVADVYFLMDTTGSMGGAVNNLKANIAATIIPAIRTEIPDTWFGAGGFDDYPVSPYGSAPSGDRAFYHLQDLTGDVAAAMTGVNGLSTHFGADGPESMIPALWAVATGNGLPGSSGWPETRSTSARGPCPAEHVGWPCFRPGAVPIVVAITDVNQHGGPSGSVAYSDAVIGGHAPTYAEAIDALSAARIRVIGVAFNSRGREDLVSLATDTGAVDAGGAALVSNADGDGVSLALINQIRVLANQTPLDISIVYEDDPADAVETFSAFVSRVEANTAGDLARGCEPRAGVDTDGDGFPDTFLDVTPGSLVCFDIVVKTNTTVEPTTEPQLFRATLRLLGDGFTELDSRDVFFLVPPDIPDPMGPN